MHTEMPHVCGELEWYREAAAFASILRGEGFFVAEKSRVTFSRRKEDMNLQEEYECC